MSQDASEVPLQDYRKIVRADMKAYLENPDNIVFMRSPRYQVLSDDLKLHLNEGWLSGHRDILLDEYMKIETASHYFAQEKMLSPDFSTHRDLTEYKENRYHQEMAFHFPDLISRVLSRKHVISASQSKEGVLDKLERLDESVQKIQFIEKFYGLTSAEKLTVALGNLRGVVDGASIPIALTEGELFEKYITSKLNKTDVVSALEINLINSGVKDDSTDVGIITAQRIEDEVLLGIKSVVAQCISRYGVSGDAFCESTDAIDIIDSFSHSFTEEERDELVEDLEVVLHSSLVYLESRLNYKYNYGNLNSPKPINPDLHRAAYSKEFADLFYEDKSVALKNEISQKVS